MTGVNYANGSATTTTLDAANRPWRIQATGPTGVLWDSGVYSFDGAGNIDAIGNDIYRYDQLSRLRYGRTSGKETTYNFDAWGNMVDYLAPGGPTGLGFSGRAYSSVGAPPDNRIHSAGFEYDANGNLGVAPSGTAGESWFYAFDHTNWLREAGVKAAPLSLIANFVSLPTERYLYDADGRRVFREDFAKNGRWTYFLRDGSSNVLSEWQTDPAGAVVEHERYVYALDRPVASGLSCGPAPYLELETTWNLPDAIAFRKRDATATLATEPYTVDIQPDGGARREYSASLTPNTTDWVTFTIPKSAFSANVTNRVRLQGRAECGGTGYSNEVSLVFSASGGVDPGCGDVVAGHRIGDPGSGSHHLHVIWDGDCNVGGTTYDLYYRAFFAPSAVLLATNLASPEFSIYNLGNSGGRGNYWVIPKPPGHGPLPASPQLAMTGSMVYLLEDPDNPESLPVEPSWSYRFHHLDHLGSVRAESDVLGHALVTRTYYPFGAEIPPLTASNNSHRFAGHERDVSTGFDYMMARYYSNALTRFVTPDTVTGEPKTPASWNKYAYVANSPINLVDPDGQLERDATGQVRFDLGRPVILQHGGDPLTDYGAHAATLYTEKGNPIPASTMQEKTFPDGNLYVKDTNLNYDSHPDSTNPMFSNCHGTTFADGKFWINNEAVDRILKDEYTKVSGPAKIGDVVIYRNSAGTPVHSVTVTEVDSAGTPTKAKGEAGLQTEVKETAVGPGPGTAWRDPNVSIEIYRKSQPVPLPQKQRDSRFQYQKNN